VDKGADPNHICQNKTPADWAFENGKIECVAYLRTVNYEGYQFCNRP